MSGSDGTLTDDWNTMFAGSSGTHYLYNNTVVGRIFGPFAACYAVELSATPTMVFKNNIGDRGANPDVNSGAYLLPGATTTGSSNNLSDDASAPGSNVFVNRHPLYVDETNGDLHIHSTDDSGVRNNGVDLSADANIAFSDDIDGTTRPVDNSWDLGADESAAPALPVGGSGSSIFAFDRFKTGELSSSDERKWF
jgi:hypothetical protein